MTYHFRAAAIPSPAAALAAQPPSARPPAPPDDPGAPHPPPPHVPALDDPALRETALFDRARQSAFVVALAECGSARAAARACGVSHQTVYRQRRACAVFRRAWDGALIAARAVAEEALACRAIDGLEEKVWFRGEVVGTRRRYDTRLLLAHLARLDKLADNAEARAFAEDFDAALGRFEQGSDSPEIDPDAPPPEPASEPAPAEAEKKAPGQCNTRSTPSCTSPADDSPFAPERAARMAAMEACRPEGAPGIYEFPPFDPVDVACEQLEAFEAGLEDWFLIVPPGKTEPDEKGWCYWEG